MLNIISRSIVEGGVNGPQKVASNLMKGLDILGYPYCVNKALDATSQLWIHDDLVALKEASEKKLKAVIGPNLFLLSRYIPADLDMSNFVYVYPSKWSADFWKDFGFNKCPQALWPAGIDTSEYISSIEKKDKVLIYFKQRYEDELIKIETILKNKNLKYSIIKYGSYLESNYKKELSKSKYVIWLGRHETQGIALQDALSTNTPIILCEVKSLGQWMPTQKESSFFTKEESAYKNVTVAPYFSDDCGIKIYDLDEIDKTIDYMENNFLRFLPRKYIIENLSLEKQARDFLNLYEKYFNINFNHARTEKLSNKKNWVNAKLNHVIYFKIKRMIKAIFKILKNMLVL
ncbi:MAG: hypothetical protein ABIF22_00725 [bacterium]